MYRVPQRALWWLKYHPHNTVPPWILLNCQFWACAVRDLKEGLSGTTNMDPGNNFEVEEKPVVILKIHRNSLHCFYLNMTRLASKVSLSFRKMETLSCIKPFKKSKHLNWSLNRSAFFYPFRIEENSTTSIIFLPRIYFTLRNLLMILQASMYRLCYMVVTRKAGGCLGSLVPFESCGP